MLVAVMLLMPFLDQFWSVPQLKSHQGNRLSWLALCMVIVLLLIYQPHYTNAAIRTLVMAGLPEEWFFRAYFMMRVGAGLRANLVTSLLFSLLHGLSRDWITALLVFAPSLFYGWLYQRTRDLVLVVLVHALSNLIYFMVVADWVEALL